MLDRANANNTWLWVVSGTNTKTLFIFAKKTQALIHVSILFWVVGQRRKSFIDIFCHSVLKAFIFFRSILSMKMNTLCWHITQIISRILNIMYFVTFHYHLSLPSKNIDIQMDVKIALSIAWATAAATPLKDVTFIAYTHNAHTSECFSEADPGESSLRRTYNTCWYKTWPLCLSPLLWNTLYTLHAIQKCICLWGTLNVCNKVITWSQALNWLPWKPHFRIIRDNLIRDIDPVSPPTSKYPIDCILSKGRKKTGGEKPFF